MDRLTNLHCNVLVAFRFTKNIIHFIINIPQGWRGPFSGSRDLFSASSWSPWGRHRCLVLPVASWREVSFKITISTTTTTIVIINSPPVPKHHIGQVEFIEHHPSHPALPRHDQVQNCQHLETLQIKICQPLFMITSSTDCGWSKGLAPFYNETLLTLEG